MFTSPPSPCATVAVLDEVRPLRASLHSSLLVSSGKFFSRRGSSGVFVLSTVYASSLDGSAAAWWERSDARLMNRVEMFANFMLVRRWFVTVLF